LQEQHTVKDLEELAARLMDGAQNCLAVLSEGPQESHDGPSTLRVETGGRLVQEEKKLWLCSELDTDGSALAVLDAEGTNDGVCVVLEATHLETLVDVGLLLSERDLRRLAELGGEKKCLANGGLWLVRIGLLAVTAAKMH